MTIQLIHDDCLNAMRGMADASVDLIVTSPPYADARKSTYGGVAPDDYVAWFLPISDQMRCILKPDGTLIINIKEKVSNGERHTYVLELILAMRRQGWLWTEEFIWHKKSTMPGKWRNRFRDGWERCLQFNKESRFNMYQDAVLKPVATSTESKVSRLGSQYNQRRFSKVGSGFNIDFRQLSGRDMVLPDNVLHLSTESHNQGHSAAFPVGLPLWFIKLFSKTGDIVLDPFMGSGTTGVAAKRLFRDFIGVEQSAAYFEVSQKRLARVVVQRELF